MKQFKEQELVARLQNPATQRRAFEEMVSHFSESLYWQIRRMVTYHDDADDVLQNTFLKAWNSIGSFRGDAKLSTWLFKIAYNESLTFLSKQKDTISLDTNILDDDDDAPTLANTLESDAYFDGDETEAMLQAAVASLPAKQRAVFNMKYFQEMKYEDMAEITGTSIGALKASFHIAVKKIEEYFQQRE